MDRTTLEFEASSNELSLGDTGAEIIELQARLTTYGYFPNAELAASFAAWRPLVAENPEPGLFDELTEEAVRQLQANYGLAVTGRLDTTTRRYLSNDRCGVPDGIAPVGETSKFSLTSGFWNPGTLKYRVDATDDGLTTAQIRTATANALATWTQQQSDMSAAPASAGETPNIVVTFADLAGGFGLCQAPSGPTSTCTLNTDITWSVASPTPSGSLDVEAALLHELAHSLGVGHSGACRTNRAEQCTIDSAFGHATMFPFVGAKAQFRNLATYDDYQAISALYDQYESVTGLANDIAVADRVSNGAWRISNLASGSEFKVEKWNESSLSWTLDASMTGVRIAVTSNNLPWVVKSSGQIWARDSAGTWSQKTGCAKDIGIGGVGGNDSIWIIGCTPSGSSFKVEKWSNNRFVVDASGGAGVRISVGRYGNLAQTPDSNVVPWVVAANNTIWRRPNDDVTSTALWNGLVGRAKDIAVCGDGLNFAWVIGTDDNLHMWNEQRGFIGTPGSDAPTLATWTPISGTRIKASRGIACGGAGLNRVWAIDSRGTLKRNKR
jgi:peptidoglycan hydrolase-like protein with peptidoglycan-binding domain